MKIKGYILGISVAMASLLVSSCDTDNLTDVYQSSTMEPHSLLLLNPYHSPLPVMKVLM